MPFQSRILVLGIALAATSAVAQVTPYGSYATSVVIDVPAYYRIAPLIALRYNSASHDGQLGEGWNLTATSCIDRQSLGRGVPGYNANDIFVLDGQELIPCAAGSASPSCTSGGTHSTKIDDYRKILWDPNANTWKIWEKDTQAALPHHLHNSIAHEYRGLTKFTP